MDKERFSVDFVLLMDSLRNVLVKTNEEEFLYFLMVLPNMINSVANRKNLKVATKYEYSVDKVEIPKEEQNVVPLT